LCPAMPLFSVQCRAKIFHANIFCAGPGRKSAGPRVCAVPRRPCICSWWATVAARAPCNVFDPWVRWDRGQVGLGWDLRVCPSSLPSASRNLKIWNLKNPQTKVLKNKSVLLKMLARSGLVGRKTSDHFSVHGKHGPGKRPFFHRFPWRANRQTLLLSTVLKPLRKAIPSAASLIVLCPLNHLPSSTIRCPLQGNSLVLTLQYHPWHPSPSTRQPMDHQGKWQPLDHQGKYTKNM